MIDWVTRTRRPRASIAGARAGRVKAGTARDPLLGRTFFDGSSDVRVVGLCPSNPSHVMLERRADGRRWTYRRAKLSTIGLQPREIAPRFIRIDELKRLSALELRRNFGRCHFPQQTDELPLGERISG